jgi:replicative DNA helicase
MANNPYHDNVYKHNQEKMLQELPNDPEAEQAILSNMITDKDALICASENLLIDDFYRSDHKLIFNAIHDLLRKSTPVDIITLKNELETTQLLDKIGGVDFLTNLINRFYTSANLEQYIKIIKDKSILRSLIKASNEILLSSYRANKSAKEILEDAEKRIFNIFQDKNTSEFIQLREILVETIDNIERVYKSKKKITGISTGFIEFDNKTAGLQDSDLILLAARPSMGKTALALNIIENVAINSKIPVGVFSLEMSKQQLASRLLCSQAMVDAQNLRMGRLQQDDWSKIVKALAPLSEAQIFIDDTPGISVNEVRSKTRKLKIEKNIGLIVIDYLQLMSCNVGKTNSSRQQEISDISRSLKSIARESFIPIIVLSQLSRACEARADHRPILSDLRESGAIEQDADLVLFLYRDEYYNIDSDKKNCAELIIAKQRNGPTGVIDLLWSSTFTKFMNLDKSF